MYEVTSAVKSGTDLSESKLKKEMTLKNGCYSIITCVTITLMVISVTQASSQQRGSHSRQNDPHSETCYMFSHFKGDGEDGLHLAYSYDGWTWKPLSNGNALLRPKVGRDKLMRDPCIISGPDGRFHMVWTVSWREKGIGYAHSADLIHWSDQKYIPVMEHEPNAKNSWAPELFYDDVTERYVIFWATTIPGSFPKTDGQVGGKLNHRMYYTTTTDFKTFTQTRLFYDYGFNVIDATIVKDDNRYVMFLKDETNQPFRPQKNIRFAVSKNAEGPYGPPSPPITGNYWCEGPSAIKIRDTWFVYFDKYREHRYGAVISKDLKTWQDVSNKVNFPRGTRHGTVFEVSKVILSRLLAAGQPAHN